MKVKFKEVANFIAGQSPKSEYYNENKKGMAFLQGNRTFGRMYPNIDTYTTKVTKVANVGDILISVRAPVGELNIANETICTGRGLGIINSDKYNNKFLYYVLIYNIKNLIKQGNGTTFSSITKDIINEFTMIIPDNDINKIETLLFSIDKIIENNMYLKEQLEEAIETIYNYWFLQFDFPNEVGKPYRSSGGEMVYNEKLKMDIPKGWKTTKVKKICDNLDSKRKPLSSKKRLEMKGSIPYYGACSVMDYVNDFIFDGEFVLLAEDGSIMNEKGNPILQIINGKTWVNNHAHVLSPKKDYSVILLRMLLKDVNVNRIKTGSIQPKITKTNLNEYDIIEIPLALRKRINNMLMSLYELIEGIKKENLELEELKNYLLPLLMNGQVGFKEDSE